MAKPEKIHKPFFSTETAIRVIFQSDFPSKVISQISGNPSVEKRKLELHHPCSFGVFGAQSDCLRPQRFNALIVVQVHNPFMLTAGRRSTFLRQ